MRKFFADVDHILVPIQRAAVETGDVSATVEVFETFAASRDMAMSVLGRVVISVSGYDDDPRPLWEVPEVRRFFARLHRAVPHMLFFLSPEKQASALWVMLCCELTAARGALRVDQETMIEFVTDGFAANNVFCESIGIDPSAPELVDLTFRLTDALTGK